MTERCGNEATVASFSACVYNNKLLDVLTVLQACYQVVRLQECANMLTLHAFLLRRIKEQRAGRTFVLMTKQEMLVGF